MRHHAARHVLVAAADHEHAVHALARCTAVSMQSAITSRDTSEYFMPSVPIADAVGDRRRCRRSAALAPASLSAAIGAIGERLHAGVARSDRRVAVGDADHRLVEVVVSEADARSIARFGERATPWVMMWLRRLFGTGFTSLV